MKSPVAHPCLNVAQPYQSFVSIGKNFSQDLTKVIVLLGVVASVYNLHHPLPHHLHASCGPEIRNFQSLESLGMITTYLWACLLLDSATIGSAEASPSKDPSKTIVAILSWLLVLLAISTSSMYKLKSTNIKIHLN